MTMLDVARPGPFRILAGRASRESWSGATRTWPSSGPWWTSCRRRGGALLLSGEPGVGKSALLDAAEETAAAAGIRVLRAAGAEFEDVSFCGLNQLLLPLRGDLGRLDGVQRDA